MGASQIKGVKKERVNELIRMFYSKQQECLNLDHRQHQWAAVLLSKKIKTANILKLRLNQCGILDSEIPVLAGVNLKKLQVLWLNENPISSKSVKLLVKMQFPQLQLIGLGDTIIGSEGIKYLVKSRWPNLKIIVIEDCKSRFHGNLQLAGNNWRRIQQINITHQFSDDRSNPIQIMAYVRMNWLNKNIRMVFKIQNVKIEKDIKSILKQRFQL